MTLTKKSDVNTITPLQRLEAESIHILREAFVECSRPFMLFSAGKDSMVLLHLARKAFFPDKIPFPFLHIDTGWKFKETIRFRDRIAKNFGLELYVYKNPEGEIQNINPFIHGPTLHTDIMKTQALKLALDKYEIDAAIAGARREEEASRAKERVFSFRPQGHSWDPKKQRPELWNIYNTRIFKGESFRVFPLSDWAEIDIWNYIKQESIEISKLYFAAKRPVVKRDGTLIMVDDERMQIAPNEKIQEKMVRFRSLGCYPLTGACESNAENVSEIIEEIRNAKTSERKTRLIDQWGDFSMEEKKADGYF